MEILRPKGKNSSYYYTVSNVNINSNGTGSLRIEMTNKETNKSLTPDTLNFTNIKQKFREHIMIHGIFYCHTYSIRNNLQHHQYAYVNVNNLNVLLPMSPLQSPSHYKLL